MKPGVPSDPRKAFLGRGWAWPVDVDPRTGHVRYAEYEDDIEQSILIILQTAPGERVMRPDFGCGIHDMVFEAFDATGLQRLRSLVDEALRRYEPRIEVLAVNADDSDIADGRLMVDVDYRVRQTNQTGNLVFPFYFREGGRP